MLSYVVSFLYVSEFLLNFFYLIFCLFVFSPEPNVLAGTLVGHTDAVWGLAYSGIKNQLLSCSADGTVRLWNPQEKLPCVCTYNGDKSK